MKARKRPRIYIAGPMTGLPDHNYPAFHEAANLWREHGWDVANPAENFEGRHDLSYSEYVAVDLELLRTCDAIALLPGWCGPDARGSVWEMHIATQLLKLPAYNAEQPFRPEDVKLKWHEPETILQEAQRLVHGDRGAAYGHPIVDYRATGRMWGAILERWLGTPVPDIDPRIACLMMVAVKLSREASHPKRDNRVDGAGYFECADMIATFDAD